MMARRRSIARTSTLFVLSLGLAGCQQQTGPAPAPALPDAGSAGVLNVADAAIAGNDPQMALKVSQSVLASDPTNLQALYHEADAYYAVGRCQDAIAAYKVALGLNPKSSPAETGIGRCLLKRDAAAAEQAFAAAVQDDPGNAVALDDLGIARDLQGNYAGATQPYEQALLITPGSVPTEVNLGFSLALSGDSADALQYLGPLATGTDATPKIREDYAAALVAAGRTDEARQVLSVDLPPDDIPRLITAFQQTIAAAPPQAPAPAAPAPTVPQAASAPVAAAPLTPATPAVAAPTPAPAVITPPATPAPQPPAPTGNAAAGSDILR
jgi:Flp pilus assembly protein TadD